MNDKVCKTLTEFISNLNYYERKWATSPDNAKSFLLKHQHALNMFGKDKEKIINGLLRFAAMLATEPEVADESYPAINFMHGQTD